MWGLIWFKKKLIDSCMVCILNINPCSIFNMFHILPPLSGTLFHMWLCLHGNPIHCQKKCCYSNLEMIKIYFLLCSFACMIRLTK